MKPEYTYGYEVCGVYIVGTATPDGTIAVVESRHIAVEAARARCEELNKTLGDQAGDA